MLTPHEIEILHEYQRRQEHAINVYTPTILDGHNQLSYHKSTARYRLLFGGNQSGKSHAAAYDCACNARGKNPFTGSNIKGRDVEIWVISTEYLTIKKGIYRHLKNILPDWDGLRIGAKIVGTDLPSFIEVTRPDGFKTIIQFMSAKSEDMRTKFQGAAVDYFYIDEEIPEVIWEELEARTLATGGKFSISATLVESYDWITKLERMGEAGDPNVFLTRLNTELNIYLDKAVVALLGKKWSKETKEYRFYGKSKRKQGIVYNTWDKDRHECKPFKIPLDWPRWCAIDPGIRTCAVLWIAVGPDNKAYAYRELYVHNEPLWQVAIDIKEFEGWKLDKDLTLKFGHYVWVPNGPEQEEMVIRLIDPKGRARSEAGEESIITQLYEKFGLLCTPADNALRPGLEDCRFWLENGFQVFDTCINFLEERRVYRYRQKSRRLEQSDPIEDPIRKYNHLMDCWRYIAREKPKFTDRRLLTSNVEFEETEEPKTVWEKIEERKNQVLVNDILGDNW